MLCRLDHMSLGRNMLRMSGSLVDRSALFAGDVLFPLSGVGSGGGLT